MTVEVEIHIRKEEPRDYPEVYCLVQAAFREVEESDHTEHYLVERLRASEAFVPELSLVAETIEGKIVGYVLFTKVEIVANDAAKSLLGVAPLAVLPDYQKQGIGGALLEEAHRRAIKSGYKAAVLLGHAAYYPRFGYRKASDFGIIFPFDVPDECCMAIELMPDALKNMEGNVRYAKEFFE